MKKLSNAEAELKKELFIKKACNEKFGSKWFDIIMYHK